MCHREDVAAVKMVAKVKVVTMQRYRPGEDGATVKMWPRRSYWLVMGCERLEGKLEKKVRRKAVLTRCE